MRFKAYEINSYLVVVAAGLSGICADIEFARCGIYEIRAYK